MAKFQAPAILTRIAYLKDGGLSLGFSTNELSDEDKVIASRFHQKFGYVLFAENELQDDDIPKDRAESDEKTPSKRLRDVLFVQWKQLTEKQISTVEFEYFYRRQMDRIINSVKEKLEE